jgi:hypothetical protein
MMHEVNRFLPKPKKEEQPWRYRLTLCMAAVCGNKEPISIVTCSDMMSSTDWTKAETLVKDVTLLPPYDLAVMVAGEVSRCDELLDISRHHLRSLKAHHVDWEKDPIGTFRTPLYLLKQRLIEQHVQLHVGMSYKEFKGQGGKGLHDSTRARISQTIYGIRTKIQLIIYGFDRKGHPLLLVFDDEDGLRRERDFACIGVGATAAYLTLCRREQDQVSGLERTLYNLFEAKKLGEQAPTVGRFTVTIVSDPGFGREAGKRKLVRPEGAAFLERLYRKYGPKDNGKIKDFTLPHDMF